MYGDSKSQAQGIVGRRESGSNILPALPSAQIAADNYLHASPAPAVGCKARVCHHAPIGEAHALLSVQQRIDRDLCVCCIRSSGISNSGRRATRSGMLSSRFQLPAEHCARLCRNAGRKARGEREVGDGAQLPADTREFLRFPGRTGYSPFRSSMNGLWGSMTTGSGAGHCPQYRLVLYADIARGL